MSLAAMGRTRRGGGKAEFHPYGAHCIRSRDAQKWIFDPFQKAMIKTVGGWIREVGISETVTQIATTERRMRSSASAPSGLCPWRSLSIRWRCGRDRRDHFPVLNPEYHHSSHRRHYESKTAQLGDAEN
jgi:hypothetical protein